MTAQKREPELPAPPDVDAIPGDAERTASGLASKRLKAGTGEHPHAYDLLRIHYSAWTPDGRLFDSTHTRNAPAEVPLELAIAGWREGIPLMTVGEIRRFWIPGKLAYAGRPGWPPGPVVFDIELLGFEKRPQPPTAPSNLTAPPQAARQTESGLTWLVLDKGKGKEHPGPLDVVTVHYNGWTSDGKLFDSSYKHGMPATFPLSRVIAGWTEGLQLMVVGERRRFWVPPELAYRGREGPQGTLVYDLELLALQKMPAPPPRPEAPSEELQGPPRPPRAQP